MDGQDNQGGYSTLFYIMLAVGVIGLLGLVLVLLGAAR